MNMMWKNGDTAEQWEGTVSSINGNGAWASI